MSGCLDAWAVLAWLDGESPACERVESLLPERPVMSWMNAVEVYCRLERDHGRRTADDVLAELRTALDLDLPGVARMTETARLKARLPIALGECFAIATAAAHDLPLLTGDPEILERGDLPCPTVDLRASDQARP
jgi:PIN domain nuclease of toxin-antitoxin system